MVLAGRMSWNLPKTDTTNRWCLAWRDGLQPRILVTEEILHLVMATWLRWLPLMVVMVFKVPATVETEETEEILVEIKEITQIKEIATLMVVAPTSMRISEVGVAKVANPVILPGSHPLPANSLSLT